MWRGEGCRETAEDEGVGETTHLETKKSEHFIKSHFTLKKNSKHIATINEVIQDLKMFKSISEKLLQLIHKVISWYNRCF